jgi:hypothetical protein
MGITDEIREWRKIHGKKHPDLYCAHDVVRTLN